LNLKKILKMTTIKFILLGFLGLILLILIIAIFIKKDFSIEQEVIIIKPKQEVFGYIKYLKNQDNYLKWFLLDKNMQKDFKGIDGKVGFVYSWKSENKNVGIGEQEITNIVEGERIDIEIRFTVPFQSTDPSYMTTEVVSENQTKVKNGYKGKMRYPTNLLTQVIKSKIEKDMHANLINLKNILEKQ